MSGDVARGEHLNNKYKSLPTNKRRYTNAMVFNLPGRFFGVFPVTWSSQNKSFGRLTPSPASV